MDHLQNSGFTSICGTQT